MDPTDIPLFALADQRLVWVDHRQALLSQNVANVDTPGYRARDLRPFAQALADARFDIAPVRTDPLHLAGTVPGASAGPAYFPASRRRMAMPCRWTISLNGSRIRIRCRR